MAREITNSEDVIDSRDVIERAGELAGRWTASGNGDDTVEPLDEDERAELDTLSALIDEASDYADDWQYGATLIRDSYFETYAQEFAEEFDMIPADAKWPANHIDWEAAAEELQTDYTEVTFGGVTYWIR